MQIDEDFSQKAEKAKEKSEKEKAAQPENQVRRKD